MARHENSDNSDQRYASGKLRSNSGGDETRVMEAHDTTIITEAMWRKIDAHANKREYSEVIKPTINPRSLYIAGVLVEIGGFTVEIG